MTTKSNKKILILITKANIGGAQIFALSIAKYLKKSNIDVLLAFGDGNFLPKELQKERINFKTIKNLKRSHSPVKNILAILEIKKLIDKEKIDIIHINSSNALLGALSARLSRQKPRTIFTFHGMSLLDDNYKKNKIILWLYYLYFKFFLLFVDKNIFVCEHNKNIAKKKLKIDGQVIYNGIKTPHFLPKIEARNILSKKININLNNNFIIGSIGRLDWAKNYEFLIQVFPQIKKIIPNAKIIIIGSGTEKDKLNTLIQNNKLKNDIFLIPEIPNASHLLPAFDLFALVSRYEGLSLTALEALSADLPMILSDVGGNKEISNNVFELNNQRDFLDKLKNIYHAKHTNKGINTQNRDDKINKFTLDKMISEYQKIYK